VSDATIVLYALTATDAFKAAFFANPETSWDSVRLFSFAFWLEQLVKLAMVGYNLGMTMQTQAKGSIPQQPKPNKALKALEQTFERLRLVKVARDSKFDPFLGSDEFRDR
jgi:hypothetical protein